MLPVVDVIARCRDKADQERGLDQLRGIMLHRVGIDLKHKPHSRVLGYTGPEVSDVFTGRDPAYPDVAKATGGQNAYTFLIGGDCGPAKHDGVVWQCLPLDEIGHHARRWSRGWIGVGWIADPRVRPLSAAARVAAVELCAALCNQFGWSPANRVRGHGEVEGAHGGEKAPGKPDACPGLSVVELDAIRHDIAMARAGAVDVVTLGVVFSA